MRFLLSANFLFLACGLALAQDPTVTEADFLRPVGEAHAAVRALTDEIGRAEAARVRAGTLSNPRVEFSFEEPSDNQTTLVVGWAPPLDGRFGLAKEAAQAGLDAARNRLLWEKLRLRRELRAAFAEWALSSERANVLRQQSVLLRSLAEQSRRRAQAGEEAGMTAVRLSLAAEDLAGALALAEADAARGRARARAWRPDLPEQARPSRPPLPPAVEPPAAAAARPDVEAFRNDVNQAQLEGRLARRFVVFPELQAGWQRHESGGIAQEGPFLGIAWSIPIFDRFQASRVEATRRQLAVEARLSIGVARAAAELEAARAAYGTLVGSAGRAQEAAAVTDRLIEGATASFRAGESTVTDVISTLDSVRTARLREIELYGAALEAHRELETAAGRPLPSGGQ